MCQPYNTFWDFSYICLLTFVLSDVIVEDIVGLCTCTYKEVMYYSIVVLCIANCDNVDSSIKTVSQC